MQKSKAPVPPPNALHELDTEDADDEEVGPSAIGCFSLLFADRSDKLPSYSQRTHLLLRYL